ncbi:MAG: glycerophosphoryl diester phosphodiesterase membrane domain-containing protein, partial [Bacillota bacterium]|nr:glycerophosphoryl diester phosphodiesterase membrane domain-containing protein [Bacillota bacterium]
MSLFRYSGAIPHILLFQMITKVILVLIVGILSSFIDNLGSWSGIGVITNLDLPFLFRSFPGLCILFLVFLVVCVYTIFDIHVMILISDNVLHDKKQSIWMILKNAILAIRYMIYPETILVLLFVVLVAPLTFSFIGISLTESFYIPDFILSVVKVNPFFAIPYYIFLIIMAYLGFVYVFTFQFMLLRKVNIKEALYTSKCSMKKHWKDFLKRYGLFVIKFLLF